MKLRSKFAFVLSSLAMLASFLVCALILGVTADVIVRNLFSRTIRGIDELSEYMLYLICLLPAPWLVWQRQHIRIDLVLNFLSQRAANRAESAIDIASVLVCGLFATLGLSLVIGSANSISDDTVLICDVFCTSTTGLWPLTVTVSSSAPTFISASIFAAKPDCSSIPSRLIVLNPVSEKVTA